MSGNNGDDKDKDEDKEGIEIVKRAGKRAWEKAHPPKKDDKDKEK